MIFSFINYELFFSFYLKLYSIIQYCPTNKSPVIFNFSKWVFLFLKNFKPENVMWKIYIISVVCASKNNTELNKTWTRLQRVSNESLGTFLKWQQKSCEHFRSAHTQKVGEDFSRERLFSGLPCRVVWETSSQHLCK